MEGLPDKIKEFIEANVDRYLYGSEEVYFYRTKEMEEVNRDLEMAEYLPDYICIAGNGCGAVIFYKRTDVKLYSNAIIGMFENDMIFVADNLTDFIRKAEDDLLEIY